MTRFDNLTGQRFGRLVVLSRNYDLGNSYTWWNCKCDCGNEKAVRAQSLKCGETRSCGCLQKEIMKSKMSTHEHTINRQRERLYGVWASMLTRTRNPNATNYKYYGGRGIQVCKEWLEYGPFRTWSLENGYDPDAPYGECTLDRIDDNGDYCPENCRWVNQSVQANNQRSNHLVEYKGEIHNLKQWSVLFGMNYSTFRLQFYKGIPMEEIEENANRLRERKNKTVSRTNHSNFE